MSDVPPGQSGVPRRWSLGDAQDPAYGPDAGPGADYPLPTGPAAPREAWLVRADLRQGGVIVLVLAAVGAALGWVWQAWSPPRILGVIVASGVIPDEKETWIASDGRFAVIGLAVGAVAGVLVWSRKQLRGWFSALALAVGGVCGSLLMDLVGHATGGGQSTGPVDSYVHLPVEVRAVPVLFAESLAALLVVVVWAIFSSDDELGRGGVPEAVSSDAA